MNTDRIRIALITAMTAYAAVLVAGVVHHTMWLDEMQVWCLARDSPSIGDLFHNLRNEGHPPLWPLLVWSLARSFNDPLAMGVLHGLFALACAWLILFKSPFPWGWRILMVFGYYTMFEYAIPARNYAPGMLALFCAAHAHVNKRQVWVATCLLVLAFTHYWGIAVAVAWTIAALLDHGSEAQGRWLRHGIILGGAALAFLLASPRIDLPYTPKLDGVFTLERMEAMERILTQLFLPVPDTAHHAAWNTSFVVDRLPQFSNWIGLVITLICGWCLRKSRRWTAFFVLATIGVLLFPWLAPFRGMRYYGPVLLAFLAAVWAGRLADRTSDKMMLALVPVLLALQVAGGAVMTSIAFRRDFSTSRDAVQWLRENALADLPVVVDPYQSGPSISGYLGRPVYYPVLGTMGSYCHWGWRSGLDRNGLIDALKKVPFERYVLVTNEEDLQDEPLPYWLKIQALVAFGGSLIASEDHRLYLVGTTLDGHEARP